MCLSGVREVLICLKPEMFGDVSMKTSQQLWREVVINTLALNARCQPGSFLAQPRRSVFIISQVNCKTVICCQLIIQLTDVWTCCMVITSHISWVALPVQSCRCFLVVRGRGGDWSVSEPPGAGVETSALKDVQTGAGFFWSEELPCWKTVNFTSVCPYLSLILLLRCTV